VIREQSVSQVILLELPEEADRYRKLIADLEHQGVRLLILNNLEEKLFHPVWYLEDDGHHFIGLRKEPLENPLNRTSKRTWISFSPCRWLFSSCPRLPWWSGSFKGSVRRDRFFCARCAPGCKTTSLKS
jgi:hypothetical protein